MSSVERVLRIDLPERQSAFLWGPRKTGKTTWLRSAFPESIRYDLLETDLFLELSKRPSLLREQLLAVDENRLREPVIIDEVQKVPALLDEIHWLIENRGLRFILCGSSARKLRRGRANLLGGRAWRFEMHPFVSAELDDLDLLRALNRGLVPAHYLGDGYRKSLSGYVEDYLREEVFAEGLTRNLPAFARFLDAVAFSHGELINYSNIASDCGVAGKTVKEYFQILSDTLVGTRVEPYRKRQSRQVITKAPRFYLFDVGVAGALLKRTIQEERGEAFGRAFEHFILMELVAHRSYRELGYDLNFWRTKSGLEVDFILGGGEVAIEVKGSHRVGSADLRPLRAFVEEHAPRRAIVVANESRARISQGIEILPWKKFLTLLWDGEILA